jgi:uncharacterized protein YdeI (YjbR/CyaY-like superfamily)
VDIGEKLAVSTREEWRDWLERHGQERREIWLVLYKKAAKKRGVDIGEAIQEALCFGWIDSQMKGIDAESYALRFTPRRAKSPWSEANRALARQLLAEGRMSDAGRAVLPPDLLAP